MSFHEATDEILNTSVTWAMLERRLRVAFHTNARLGANKSVIDIGDGNGYSSCCGLVTCDWEGENAEENLPQTVVLKIPSCISLKRMNDSLPADQKMFYYDEAKWASMQDDMIQIHNTEVATYDFFEEFEGLAMPIKYCASAAGYGRDGGAGYLCLQYMENSRIMRFYEVYSVGQVKQMARALGKIQACSLKKEPTAPELNKDFYENLWKSWPLETCRGMLKGILTVDCSAKTVKLMKKIDDILPVYHASNLCSTIHTQMDVHPVLVNGDLHTGNVLIDKDTGDLAALLDWQCTHLGVGVEDLHRIALTALTADERRASTPMLVDEMYKNMVENLDGAEPPYALETLFLISDLLYPHCALFFVCSFMPVFTMLENDHNLSDEEKVKRTKIVVDKLIGSLEDILAFDIKNKELIGILKFRNE